MIFVRQPGITNYNIFRKLLIFCSFDFPAPLATLSIFQENWLDYQQNKTCMVSFSKLKYWQMQLFDMLVLPDTAHTASSIWSGSSVMSYTMMSHSTKCSYSWSLLSNYKKNSINQYIFMIFLHISDSVITCIWCFCCFVQRLYCVFSPLTFMTSFMKSGLGASLSLTVPTTS